MKTAIIWVVIRLLGASALLLYATILVYQQIGMWAIAIGTGLFAALYGGVALGIHKSLKEWTDEHRR